MRFTVYPETKLESIPSTAKKLHLARPVSAKFFEKILNHCSLLTTITLSESTKKRIGTKIERQLKEKHIEVEIVQERGRAIEVPLEKIKQAIEMRKDFRPYREIEKVTGIPKSTLHYLVKYSPKAKIKKGEQTILLV